MEFLNNTTLAYHQLEFNKIINSNQNITSTNLTDQEIFQLHNPEYNLSEFDIYKYITAYDYIRDSLNCNNITFTEGITLDQNKYNNILVDLFFINVPSQLLSLYPISVVFGIKQEGYDIKDLTKKDLMENRSQYHSEDPEYISDQLALYKSVYGGYAGNS
jgi:hypothetical protein